MHLQMSPNDLTLHTSPQLTDQRETNPFQGTPILYGDIMHTDQEYLRVSQIDDQSKIQQQQNNQTKESITISIECQFDGPDQPNDPRLYLQSQRNDKINNQSRGVFRLAQQYMKSIQGTTGGDTIVIDEEFYKKRFTRESKAKIMNKNLVRSPGSLKPCVALKQLKQSLSQAQIKNQLKQKPMQKKVLRQFQVPIIKTNRKIISLFNGQSTTKAQQTNDDLDFILSPPLSPIITRNQYLHNNIRYNGPDIDQKTNASINQNLAQQSDKIFQQKKLSMTPSKASKDISKINQSPLLNYLLSEKDNNVSRQNNVSFQNDDKSYEEILKLKEKQQCLEMTAVKSQNVELNLRGLPRKRSIAHLANTLQNTLFKNQSKSSKPLRNMNRQKIVFRNNNMPTNNSKSPRENENLPKLNTLNQLPSQTQQLQILGFNNAPLPIFSQTHYKNPSSYSNSTKYQEKNMNQILWNLVETHHQLPIGQKPQMHPDLMYKRKHESFISKQGGNIFSATSKSIKPNDQQYNKKRANLFHGKSEKRFQSSDIQMGIFSQTGTPGVKLVNDIKPFNEFQDVQIDSQSFGADQPLHAAAKRQSRKIPKNFSPDDFDERAKANSQQVTRLHEFTRENIREMEDPKKDYFDYDPDEKRKYDALKIEQLFKFQSTYKAIKWGVVVGSMFAFHRYYRTRDFNAAAHWFTVMSFLSAFNIWVSYGLQEFVTEYGSRKSLSLAARNEYHTNAYKAYIQGLEQSVRSLDDKVRPVLHNSEGIALNEFITNYDTYLKERFGTKEIEKDSMIESIFKQYEKDQASLTNDQMLQIMMMKKDKYQRELVKQALDEKALKEFANEVLERVDSVDLKSYNFDKDLDMNFRFGSAATL